MSATGETITVAAGQIPALPLTRAYEALVWLERTIAQAAEKRVDLLVLPECAYPAYLLGSVACYRAGDHLSGKEFVAWLGQQAARHRLHIVSGFVEDVGQHLYNAAVYLDDHGREIARTRKTFLWHADHDWFMPGREIRAFDSPLGRIGMVICAEARAPETIATLVTDGAELVLMPTCWVNTAAEQGRFENPQVEFMIEARAREFGVPFVCADKYGMEMPPIGYVGQSRIVRADGSVAAEAPAEGPGVIAARLRLVPPQRVWMSPSRRTRLLSDHPPVRPPSGRARPTVIAAVPTIVANDRYTGGMGESLFEPLRARGVELLLANLPQESPAERLQMLARAFDIHALAFPHRADVFELGPARVGCVPGQWVRSFAAPRTLALDGAELLFFFDVPPELAILRARAAENHVFVIGVSERWAIIIGPSGKILARSDPDRPAEVVAEIDLADAANKLVAPQTDIFDERKTELYRF